MAIDLSEPLLLACPEAGQIAEALELWGWPKQSHPPQGTCMYYQEWNRPFNSFADMENSADEDQKLIFGMLFSLKEVRW